MIDSQPSAAIALVATAVVSWVVEVVDRRVRGRTFLGVLERPGPSQTPV